MKRTIALAALVAVLSSGCSFVFVRGDVPPEKEPERWPVCTETRVWPTVDLAYALLSGAGTVVLAGDDDDLARVGLIVTVPALIGFGISTFYGWGKTERCRNAREAYERAADEGR
jgi:hypothetical protein